LPLRPLDLGERTAPGDRAVAQVVAAAAAQRPEARLRDDVDEQAARAVVLGRERVAGDVDRLDHGLRRQLPALEAVDADDAAAGHLLELLRHLGRIVRERVHLIARQRRAERAVVAIGRRFLFVAADGHGILQTLNGQHDHLPVVAAADADVLEDAGIEAGELRGDQISSRGQGDRRDALIGGLRRIPRHRLRRIVEAGDRDGGTRKNGARLIDYRHQQAAIARRRLREERRGARQEHQEDAAQQRRRTRHFRTSNFFGSIFTLIL
jgi:hypothetical protein